MPVELAQKLRDAGTELRATRGLQLLGEQVQIDPDQSAPFRRSRIRKSQRFEGESKDLQIGPSAHRDRRSARIDSAPEMERAAKRDSARAAALHERSVDVEEKNPRE